jgi:anti-sigma factor RsiW
MDGELSPEDSVALSRHLDECITCRQAALELQAGERMMSGYFQSLAGEEVTVGHGFWHRLSARLARTSQGWDVRAEIRTALDWVRLRVRWRVLIPLAAGVVAIGVWQVHDSLDTGRASRRTAQEKRELEQIRASLQDMEAELDAQLPHWR